MEYLTLISIILQALGSIIAIICIIVIIKPIPDFNFLPISDENIKVLDQKVTQMGLDVNETIKRTNDIVIKNNKILKLVFFITLISLLLQFVVSLSSICISKSSNNTCEQHNC